MTPPAEKVPGSHALHCVLVGSDFVPAGQTVQKELPADEMEPSEHARQTVESVLLFVPALQDVEQIVAPKMFDTLPPAQLEHMASESALKVLLNLPTPHRRQYDKDV